MRSESLPAEAEMVTGAVLRVYKFPAYVNMAATGGGHAHNTQLFLHVFTIGDGVTRDWLANPCLFYRLFHASVAVVNR